MLNNKFIFVVLILIGFIVNGYAADVGGIISSDTVWDLGVNNYSINKDEVYTAVYRDYLIRNGLSKAWVKVSHIIDEDNDVLNELREISNLINKHIPKEILTNYPEIAFNVKIGFLTLYNIYRSEYLYTLNNSVKLQDKESMLNFYNFLVAKFNDEYPSDEIFKKNKSLLEFSKFIINKHFKSVNLKAKVKCFYSESEFIKYFKHNKNDKHPFEIMLNNRSVY